MITHMNHSSISLSPLHYVMGGTGDLLLRHTFIISFHVCIFIMGFDMLGLAVYLRYKHLLTGFWISHWGIWPVCQGRILWAFYSAILLPPLLLLLRIITVLHCVWHCVMVVNTIKMAFSLSRFTSLVNSLNCHLGFTFGVSLSTRL